MPTAAPDNILMPAQVAIIGAGPAGLFLGQLLGNNGGKTPEGLQ
jgi:NADPH-dependent glutamate synthase beta subunit-like oxidoreductase